MTTEPAVPLSAEEIVLITPRNCGARDVERMLVTLAAKDAEYERLDADYRAMHDNLTTEISYHSDIIRVVAKIVNHIGGSATLWQTVAALEMNLREAEAALATIAGRGCQGGAHCSDAYGDKYAAERTPCVHAIARAALQSAREE